jgi:hypothetical protein
LKGLVKVYKVGVDKEAFTKKEALKGESTYLDYFFLFQLSFLYEGLEFTQIFIEKTKFNSKARSEVFSFIF